MLVVLSAPFDVVPSFGELVLKLIGLGGAKSCMSAKVGRDESNLGGWFQSELLAEVCEGDQACISTPRGRGPAPPTENEPPLDPADGT